MNIKYPTWKIRGEPTPRERLWICPDCLEADWMESMSGHIPCCHNCRGRKGGAVRMREATAKEYAEGKKVLVTVIG